MWTCVVTAIAIKPEAEVKRAIAESAGILLKCRSMLATMCHICTHVPGFLDPTESTQFSSSWLFQVGLPAPSSSCWFLRGVFFKLLF